MQYVFMLGLLIIGGTVYSSLELAKNQSQKNSQLVFSIEDAKIKNIAQKASNKMVATKPNDEKTVTNTSLNANLLSANLLDASNAEREAKVKMLKEKQQAEKNQMEYEKIQKDLQLITSDLQQKNETNNITVPANEQVPSLRNKDVITDKLSLVTSSPDKTVNTWDSNKPIMFKFNHEINLESFVEHLYFSPSPDNRFSGNIIFTDSSRKNIEIKSQFQLIKNTEYKIILTKGVLSADNKITTLQDETIVFTAK